MSPQNHDSLYQHSNKKKKTNIWLTF